MKLIPTILLMISIISFFILIFQFNTLSNTKKIKLSTQKLKCPKDIKLKEDQHKKKKIEAKERKLEKENQTPKVKIEQLPKRIKQDKMRFVIQTFKRKKTDFSYLRQIVSNILFNFTPFPLPFEIFAYTSSKDCHVEGATCNTIQRNLEMLEIQNKTIQKDDKRGIQVSGQAMDFYSLLEAVHTNCTQDEIFFFMEDDFLFCNHSALHWQLVKNWALDHYEHWNSVRVSTGMNGLFLKCELIPFYRSTVLDYYKKDSRHPIDNVMGYKWSHHYSNEKQVQYVYRYNLFSHIGHESTVFNEQGKLNDCLHMNTNSDFLWFEQYNFMVCPHYLFSPCDKKELYNNYELGVGPYIELSGSLYANDKILKENRIDIKVATRKIINCNTVCESHKMKCFPQGFLLINSGNYLRQKLYESSNLWIKNEMIDTLYHDMHIIVNSMNTAWSTCEREHPGYFRICPCVNSTLI